MADETEQQDTASPDGGDQQKKAIEKLLGIFDEAEKLGVTREKMAIVALSATLNQMVAIYGEEKTAAIIQTVPEKLLSGHFTTKPGGAVQ